MIVLVAICKTTRGWFENAGFSLWGTELLSQLPRKFSLRIINATLFKNNNQPRESSGKMCIAEFGILAFSQEGSQLGKTALITGRRSAPIQCVILSAQEVGRLV